MKRPPVDREALAKALESIFGKLVDECFKRQLLDLALSGGSSHTPHKSDCTGSDLEPSGKPENTQSSAQNSQMSRSYGYPQSFNEIRGKDVNAIGDFVLVEFVGGSIDGLTVHIACPVAPLLTMAGCRYRLARLVDGVGRYEALRRGEVA